MPHMYSCITLFLCLTLFYVFQRSCIYFFSSVAPLVTVTMFRFADFEYGATHYPSGPPVGQVLTSPYRGFVSD